MQQSSERHRPGSDYLLVAACACVASLASFLWFFLHGELLLYGDAVAHINIARRVFDSRNPGLDQLGTVWLPLPHLLSVPFVINDWMWRTGVGGSIPSMVAYVLAVVGVFRLVRGRASRLAAWLAAGLLELNPNLLYMQSTAMTESIFLAAVIWAVVYFDEFVRGLNGSGRNFVELSHPTNDALGGAPADAPSKNLVALAASPSTGHTQLSAAKALEHCGMVLAAAMLTRYDGWVLAFAIGCAAVVIAFWGSSGRFGRRPSPVSREKRIDPHAIAPASRASPGTPIAPPSSFAALRISPAGSDARKTTQPQGDTLVGLWSGHTNFRTALANQTGGGAATRRVRRSLAAFLLLCALTPALWLAHNYAVNYKPLDWWNGPYSAQAIEQRTGHGFPYPGRHNVELAAKQFLKVARLNFSSGFVEQRTPPSWAQRLSEWQTWMAALAALGTLIAVVLRFRPNLRNGGTYPEPRHAWPWLLLWLPLPFYAYAIADGGVPVFQPVWWPFSYYNVRYGLELLPAFAVFAAVAVAFVVERFNPGRRQLAAACVLMVLLAVNYWRVAEAAPICLREARVNSVSRVHLESQLAKPLEGIPPHSTLLMYTANYVGAVQIAGVHLRRVVNETRRFAWDAGLSCPAQVADYVVAANGDLVGQAVARNPRWLEKITVISTPGEPDVTVYRSRFPGR